MRLSANTAVDLAVVMKENIVGILSHMNRGLNESTNHRPLREKQRIVRGLKAVIALVGPAIAGFSPQVRRWPRREAEFLTRVPDHDDASKRTRHAGSPGRDA